MKTQYGKKIFPFAPGIPWTTKNYKYVVPEIDKKIWDRVLDGKTFIITCYGGFLESFFSLSYAEAIAKIEPNRSIKSMGTPLFSKLSQMQGITKICEFDLGPEILKNYPTPLFMDKENNAYFNVLNNYIQSKSYIPNKKNIFNKEIILKQIYQNCMIPWSNNLPILRNYNSEKYNTWKNNNKFRDNLKYILVFPEKWNSIHNDSYLGWNYRQILELSAMVRHLGIRVISCDNKPSEFYRAGQVIHAPLDLDIIIGLIMNSNYILSDSIDYLICGMMLSESIIISKIADGIFDLYENAEFIDVDNVIFMDRDLSPRDVYQFLEGAL